MIQTQFGSVRPKLRLQNFLFKNLASPITRYHGELSYCTISEITNYPILRKLSDRQMGVLTDRLTETEGQDT